MNDRAIIQARRAREQGERYSPGRRRVTLAYPSPYPVGMASLGFQTVYRFLGQQPDTAVARAFLPDPEPHRTAGRPAPLLAYETLQPAADCDVVAFSVAYELEVGGLLSCMDRMGLKPLREQRRPRDPWVVVGGPLTFSNPSPLAPFADVIVMGEAEDLLQPLLDALCGGGTREEALAHLAALPGYYIPAQHGPSEPPIVRAEACHLPARSVIISPEAALPSMFLVEAERGCSRGCAFCVMRRSGLGGMRVVPPQRVLDCVPEEAQRVGLVGAAVSDHPQIETLVEGLVDRGLQVGLSSLRADRLTPRLIDLLVRGGYRTLTVGADGASERLRANVDKGIREEHLLGAAKLAGEARMHRLKVYLMLGLPEETDDDLDELSDLTLRLAEAAGPTTRVALAIAPFVAKRNTPLDGQPFVGIQECDRRVARVRRRVEPSAQLLPVSSRWAWIEYELAQGGPLTGLAALQAWRAGGRFGAWRRALGKGRDRSRRGGKPTRRMKR